MSPRKRKHSTARKTASHQEPSNRLRSIKPLTLIMFTVSVLASVLLLAFGIRAFQSSQNSVNTSIYFSDLYKPPNPKPIIKLNLTLSKNAKDEDGSDVLHLISGTNLYYEPAVNGTNGESYCIEGVYLRKNGEGFEEALHLGGICTYPMGGAIGQDNELQPRQTEGSYVYYTGTVKELTALEYSETSLAQYPFDVRKEDLEIFVLIKTYSGKYLTIAPEVDLFIEPIEREGTIKANVGVQPRTTVYNLNIDVTQVTTIDLVLKRLASIRFLAVTLGVLLLGFIISIVFIRETSTTLEVAVGILLGLWGIQSVIIPAEIKTATLASSSIIYFYFLLAIALIIRFAVLPLYKKMREGQ